LNRCCQTARREALFPAIHREGKTVRKLIPAALALFFIAGCGTPDLLTDSEKDSIAKLRTNKYTLIANDELATLKYNADLGKSVGRYSIHHEGFQTWRLDSATGYTCLMLASDEVWKKPGMKEQGCNYLGGQ